MSVQETTYVVLGVKLNFDFFNEDEREDLRNKGYVDGAFEEPAKTKNGLTIIMDGMNGDYMVAGEVIAKAIHENGDGIPFTVLDVTSTKRDAIKQALADHLGIVSADVEAMVFTHYS